MKQMLKYAAVMLPAVGMALLCGCGMVAIEPMTADRDIQLPENLFTTTTEETVVTTTTTVFDPYSPTDDQELIDMVQGMTLRERAAQLIMVSCSDQYTAQYVSEQGAGGLCLFAGPFEWKSAAEVRSMTAGFQSAADIPILVAVDEEGGTVNRVSLNSQLRSTPFASPQALFEQGGMNLIRSDAREKAGLLLNLGVNVNLAPVCDVPLAETDFIFSRSFGLDAEATAEYVAEVVDVMQSKGLGTTLKHFPGYGGSADTHYNVGYDAREYEEFLERDFLPFEAGIEAGADAVMVSHNIVACMDSSNPASLSKAVHKILREKLGFSGVIISDDLGMAAVWLATKKDNSVVPALIAGNDMVICSDFDGSVDAILAAVEDAKLSVQQINQSVLRILVWKKSIGLLE